MTVQDRVDYTVNFLQARGFNISRIAEKLGVTRSGFYSWRGSVHVHKVAEMEIKLQEEFMEVLKEMPPMPQDVEVEASAKYIALLERTHEECTTENDRLRIENKKLYARIEQLSAMVEKFANEKLEK